jgi:hypothetical protein
MIRELVARLITNERRLVIKWRSAKVAKLCIKLFIKKYVIAGYLHALRF